MEDFRRCGQCLLVLGISMVLGCSPHESTSAATEGAENSSSRGKASSRGPQEARWLSMVRDRAVQTASCFANIQAYCLNDKNTLDPLIQFALEKELDGQAPVNSIDVDRVVMRTAHLYRKLQAESASIRRVEAKMRTRYDNPPVQTGQTVVIDIGVVPSTLELSPHSTRLRFVNSDLIENGEWVSTEPGRYLNRYVKPHPDAIEVAIHIIIPSEQHLEQFRYRYLRSPDVVLVTRASSSDHGWITEPTHGDFSAFEEGTLSLHTSKLTLCSLKDAGQAPPCPTS